MLVNNLSVHETTEFLELFLRNLLLGDNNPLQNRTMHISGIIAKPDIQKLMEAGFSKKLRRTQ